MPPPTLFVMSSGATGPRETAGRPASSMRRSARTRRPTGPCAAVRALVWRRGLLGPRGRPLPGLRRRVGERLNADRGVVPWLRRDHGTGRGRERAGAYTTRRSAPTPVARRGWRAPPGPWVARTATHRMVVGGRPGATINPTVRCSPAGRGAGVAGDEGAGSRLRWTTRGRRGVERPHLAQHVDDRADRSVVLRQLEQCFPRRWGERGVVRPALRMISAYRSTANASAGAGSSSALISTLS